MLFSLSDVPCRLHWYCSGRLRWSAARDHRLHHARPSL